MYIIVYILSGQLFNRRSGGGTILYTQGSSCSYIARTENHIDTPDMSWSCIPVILFLYMMLIDASIHEADDTPLYMMLEHNLSNQDQNFWPVHSIHTHLQKEKSWVSVSNSGTGCEHSCFRPF